MAKELPYFKFFVSEWNDGDITLEDYEVQGLFINVCSYYWSKDCDVSLVKLKKRFKGCDDNIDILILSDIIRLELDGSISIKFLIEQLEERGDLSTKNSLNAKKRWDAIRAAKLEESQTDAIALPTDSEKDAIKRREEKRREEENIKATDIYNLYPSKCPTKDSSTGKTIKNKDKIKHLLKTMSYDDLKNIITRYLKESAESKIYLKNFATLLNNLPDYTSPEPKKQIEKVRFF